MKYETIREPWTYERNPTYGAAQDWALACLGPATGIRRVLIVGSPPAEVVAFQRAGWDVTWVDCRRPPVLPGVESVHGDACDLPVTWTDRFEAVSTTCVWCHVGMGRYGDQVRPNACQTFLAELRRVCRGTLAAMVGPVARTEEERMEHRISTPKGVETLLRQTGWRVQAMRVWSELERNWVEEVEIMPRAMEPPAEYLVVSAK